MAKGRTLIKSTLLLTVSGLALRGMGVLFQGYLAGRIGAEGMGLLQLVLTVGGFAGTLGTSGVRVAVLQLAAKAQGRRDRQALAGILRGCIQYALAVSLAVGLGLIALAGPLSRGLLNDGRTAPALRIMGLFLPCSCLYGVLRGYFTACGRVRELVAVELLERPVGVGLTLLFLQTAGRRLSAVCCSVIAGSGGGALFSLILLRILLRKDRLPNARAARGEVVRLCVPLALNDYLRSGLGAVEQFLIPFGLGKHDSARAGLAAYGVICAMVFPVLTFPAEIIYALCELMVSELSRLLAEGKTRRLRSLIRKSMACTAAYALLVAGGLYAAGPLLGRAIFRSPQAGYYLRVFSPMVLFLYLDAMVDGLQKGLGQQLYLVRYNSFTNVLDVLGLSTLLPKFGIWGYLFTYCTSHLVNFFLSLRRLLTALEESCQASPGAASGHRPVKEAQ